METSIVAKGATTVEAVQNALTQLDATLPEVEVVILKNGGRSLFGIRQKEAMVKVIKKEVPLKLRHITEVDTIIDEVTEAYTTRSSSKSLSKKPIDNKSYIQFVNGKMNVFSSEHSCPVIIPHPRVSLYVNEQLVTEKRAVSEKDEIEVRAQESIEPAKSTIHVAQDEMSVSIHVQPERRTIYKIKDTQKLETLKIQVEPETSLKNPFTEKDIRKQLNQLGITTGIQDEEIKKASESLETATFILAKGIPPVEGKDGEIKFAVEVTRTANPGPRKKEDGKVDYRETGFIPSVEEGALIARIIQAQKGKSGFSVTGREVKPNPVKDVVVRLGQGVKLVGGAQIISAISGRPHVEKRGSILNIALLKEYNHDGDVNLKSGNIYFDGDVCIKGNVAELMKVEAKGEIFINGSTEKASIQSGSCIELIGNVFSSSITAGKTNLVILELTEQLEGIISHLELVNKSLHFVLNDKKVRRLSAAQTWEIFRLIVGKNNPLMMDELKSFIRKTARYHKLIDNEWSDLSTRLYKLFFTLPMGDRNVIESMDETMRESMTVYEMNKLTFDADSTLILPYAINSHLFSSGDVRVNGQGIYNSLVKAGGQLVAEGYVKGGEVHAAGGIKIGTSSSSTGVRTILKTSENGVIEIGEAFVDTIIQIGKHRHQFVKKEFNVKARLSDDGFLKIR
ncbi:FapA family protein [Domibacillus epiphyticus]|uniref:RNA-binding protein KhpB N-terminal domain-containing protein n=1 Tax=Domibacillus epiphyticus TaxID=1714355 RepID=A0A1V2A7H3_9BACI|nr:FapA family protein [Domibacillus epiphyticus]OMP66916.1 hypothetical protein BTO28_09925 [Domibacillus epiphyticus]